MIKSSFFLIAFALFMLDCISADGVTTITQPIPAQIDQIVLQTEDQEILISGFNDLETQVNEATTVFLELTELSNEWEWTAEWINESNEEFLLISDNHGEEIIIGSDGVTSNAENLDTVTVITGAVSSAANNITEAIDNAENSVEDAANNASENIQDSYNNATDDVNEAVNEIGDNIQDDYNNAVNNVTENIDSHITDNINDAANSVTGSINNVGDTISNWFGSNNN